MAEIKRFFFLRHFRAEPSSHVLRYRSGDLVASGPGLAFWFWPLATSIAEVPLDDQELPLIIHGRSADYQEVTAQGVLSFRVVAPSVLASRVDFSVDASKGSHIREPLESLSLFLSQLASQMALDVIAKAPVRELLRVGCDELRGHIEVRLRQEEGLADMGLEVGAVRISSIKPAADVERALEAPTREQIQQAADEAAFARRALAVEKERAIQEAELQNQIELAKTEEQLIAQRGQNTQHEARETAEAEKIALDAETHRDRSRAETKAANGRLSAEARAHADKILEAVRLDSEKARLAMSAQVPGDLHYALAARELAKKLETIEHLSISPDMLSPMLSKLVRAGTEKLEA